MTHTDKQHSKNTNQQLTAKHHKYFRICQESENKIVMFGLSNTRSQHTIQEVTNYLLSSE